MMIDGPSSTQESIKIRVIHSVVDNEHLIDILRKYYNFSSEAYCELIHRGMNDVYKVCDRSFIGACRVWRTGWRMPDDVAYELSFLMHLKRKELPVSVPIVQKNGDMSLVVEAPEGARSVALFEWAKGRKFGDAPNRRQAREVGTLFAKMHLAGKDFTPAYRRRANPPTDYVENLPYLRRLVSDRPGDAELYEAVAAKLYAAVVALKGAGLPFGPGHGDFHFNNFHVDEADGITLLDFDNSGEDYYVQDIACYLWGNHYGNLDHAYADQFLEGYNEIRQLNEIENELLPLFLLAKEFRLISGFAKHVNQIGHFPLRFRNLEWFAHSIAERAKSLGYI
ncbi:MAG: phosphotransferase [Rhodospirillaceae bacterium]